MTCYHVSGSVYLKFPNVASLNTFKSLLTTLATPANAVTNARNFNVDNVATLSLALGTYYLQLSLRFATQAELDSAVSQLTTQINKYADTSQYSMIEYHVCHHDEPVGAPPPEPQGLTEWGTPLPLEESA